MQGCEHIPTAKFRQIVSGRKAQGCTNEQIAEFFEISDDTLKKYYADELRTGKALFMDDVYAALKKRVAEGSDKLITLCLTHQGNWRSADGKAQTDATLELAKATEQASKLNVLTDSLVGHLVRDADVVRSEAPLTLDDTQDVSPS